MHFFSQAEAIVQLIVLALPVGVLAMLFATLLVRRLRTRTAPTERGASMPLRDDATNVAAEPSHVAAYVAALATDNSDLGTASTHSVMSGLPASAISAKSRLDDVMKRLDIVDAKSQPAALAPLYLEIAALHGEDGNEIARMNALRSAAGLAAQHGPRAVHADARLQLAEVAYQTGDLTSACEHWQIARMSLLDDGQKDASARIDQRMRDTGCPTDWVLTDF